MGDTTDDGAARGSGTRHAGRAAVAAVLVLALAALAADRSHHAEQEERDARDALALAVTTPLAADLEHGLRGVAAIAADVPSRGVAAVTAMPADAVPGASASDIGFLSVVDTPEAANAVLSDAERADPEVVATFSRARDSGQPALSGAVDVEAGRRVLLAAPVFGAGATNGPPQTSTDRRARVVGWVVAVVDLSGLIDDHAPGGARATVRVDDTAVTPSATAARSGAPARSVTVDGRRIDVAVSTAGGVGVGVTIALLVAGLLLAGLAALAVLVTGRRLDARQAEAEQRRAQVRLIGDVAPLVQQSLELAEVLPAVAVQLSDHFDLAGVALSAGASRAGQTELFSLGEAPAPDSKPVLHPPARLAAGETLTLALQRGGRSVALLQVVAGRPLDGSELESLRALTELVTAAMVNASLYASQQQALHRLRDLDALKTVFLSTASHELRTPATAIAGFASLLSESWDRFSEEQRQDFAERIAANARSLSGVVQDLLDFSLLDRGHLPLALEPIDLGAVVESVVHRLGPAFGDHEVVCTTEDAPLVAGDANGLERVATNLLTNAVKFSPAGSTITLSVGPTLTGAALVVADQGPGVPVEERERVFTRFYRGSGDAVIQTRGVGIGLSVVAEFVARMGGDVTVDDAPGGGARFTVALPSAPVPTPQESEDASTA